MRKFLLISFSLAAIWALALGRCHAQQSGLGVSVGNLTNWLSPQSYLASMPRVGPTKIAQWRSRSFYGSAINPPDYKGLMYLGSGNQGVVRNVHWTGAQGQDTDTANLTNLVLRVYADAGNIADYDNPDERYLVMYCPLSVLLSAKYQFGNSVKGTRWLDTQKKASTCMGFDLKLNMPFTNGIFISIFSNNTNAYYAYSAVSYETGAVAAPYNTWRLHADYFIGHTTAQCGDGSTSGAIPISRTYMAVSNAPGFLVGCFYANAGSTNTTSWEEGNWFGWSDSASKDQVTASAFWSSYGGEDLFKNSYYFINGTGLNYDYGTEYFATTRATVFHDSMEGYRWFGNEAPTWTNNFFFERQLANDSTNLFEEAITFYYAGVGATNILYQTESLDFFTRTGISNTLQKLAINDLVVNAKGKGWWTGADAIYPFIGGTAAQHAQNLKSSSYTITWGGTVTHGATGITGNGSTGYGDTTFNPRTAGGNYSQNSAMIFVYGGTTAPTDGGAFMAVVSTTGGQTRAGLERSGTGLLVAGLNNDVSNAGGPSVSTDFRGPLAAIRTTSTVQNGFGRLTATLLDATATVNTPNLSFRLLARRFEGFADDKFSNANLRGAAIGSSTMAPTAAKWAQFAADWDYFEEITGTFGAGNRRVP